MHIYINYIHLFPSNLGRVVWLVFLYDQNWMKVPDRAKDQPNRYSGSHIYSATIVVPQIFSQNLNQILLSWQ